MRGEDSDGSGIEKSKNKTGVRKKKEKENEFGTRHKEGAGNTERRRTEGRPCAAAKGGGNQHHHREPMCMTGGVEREALLEPFLNGADCWGPAGPYLEAR